MIMFTTPVNDVKKTLLLLGRHELRTNKRKAGIPPEYVIFNRLYYLEM